MPLESPELISFNASFFGGTGNILFSEIEGLPGQQFTLSPDTSQSFAVTQTIGIKSVRVSGTAPIDGKIVVEIKTMNGRSLAMSTVTGDFFDQILTYDVETNNTGPW